MYQIFLGKISQLSVAPLAPELTEQAPTGARRASWLAGRALLSAAITPVPAMRYGVNGKPAFAPEVQRGFSLSHSGDAIALLFSDEGEVGCDIEVIRPRPHWPRLAENLFSPGERAQIAAKPVSQQLAAFWRIWTIKEAIIKQRGGIAWQMAGIDSTAPSTLSVSALQTGELSLAVCTPTPFELTPETIKVTGTL